MVVSLVSHSTLIRRYSRVSWRMVSSLRLVQMTLREIQILYSLSLREAGLGCWLNPTLQSTPRVFTGTGELCLPPPACQPSLILRLWSLLARVCGLEAWLAYLLRRLKTVISCSASLSTVCCWHQLVTSQSTISVWISRERSLRC